MQCDGIFKNDSKVWSLELCVSQSCHLYQDPRKRRLKHLLFVHKCTDLLFLGKFDELDTSLLEGSWVPIGATTCAAVYKYYV